MSLSVDNTHLSKCLKKHTLLISKYSETHVSDLIDPCKSDLKSYLFNFINEHYSADAKQGMDEEQKQSYNLCQSLENATKRSARIHKKKHGTNKHEMFEKYRGVFMTDECYKVPNQNYEAGKVVGNTSEQIIKTCCEELGFKFIMINSITLRRSQGNLAKYFLESTQSQRINLPSAKGDNRPKKTIMYIQDVDNVFQDESGFVTGITKVIQGSRVPIIITSHKSYEESQVIKRCNKKGLQIASLVRHPFIDSSFKITLRLHIILIFEYLVQNVMKEYFVEERDNLIKGIDVDLKDLDFSDCIGKQELAQAYPNVSMLAKKCRYDLKNILSILSVNDWEKVESAIDTMSLPPVTKLNQNCVILDQILFRTSNPNQKLTSIMFEETLDDIIKACKLNNTPSKSNDETKPESEDNSQDDEFKALESYAAYANNLSDFCMYETQQHKFEETMTSKNICNVDIINLPNGNSKVNMPEVLDEFFLGAPTAKRRSSDPAKRKPSKPGYQDEYDAYLYKYNSKHS